MNPPPFSEKKIKVNYFQRKPRKGFNFSIETIFDDIRKRLADKIEAKIFISKFYNDGYYSKVVNIFNAAFQQGNDVNHITGEVHFLNLLMRKKRVILTVHDCGMMERKTGLSRKIIRWLYLVAPVKKAKILTTVSTVSKNQIIQYTGCNPDKVRVVPVAVSPLYEPSPKDFNAEKPVILHIGTGYNKNLLRLAEALNGISCHLIIIGNLNEAQLSALQKNNIDYSNEYDLSNEQILEKYHQCDILEFVSTFEGFGMPIIEANTVERVVVTSNISSMPEVAGDAACMVNPFEVEDIRNGIIKVISNDRFRNELIEKGKINKLRFDPCKIATMYFDLYKEVVGD
jgi:glycosyltransferase involved in cell wall biosynthesis